MLAVLDGLEAFLVATLAQVCWGAADGMLVEPKAAVLGSGGGAADLRVLSREAVSRFATLVVRVASFSTRAGKLWNASAGGGSLAAR